ncbi:phosphoribosyltransferase [Cupriavidus sp. AU9028]|uniref:phosphoribosyltransferase n=1 Tax=Cupriavidus sp. AU9028 TaxID=2871157 RepID=UPI001C947199|nr:phosphoribosyltransferase family protein [Cupriavidus sp. AU9028]MBY4896801.1 phosphoribosyltransferase [Cupriavidus sp. AU9028]
MTDRSTFPSTFADRREAGIHLGRHLAQLGYGSGGAAGAGPLVLALPRGGVPVAFEVARALNGQLDILLVRKIGAPGYPELALGAVVETDTPGVCHTVVNEDAWSQRLRDSGAFALERERQLVELARRQQRYREGAPVAAMRGRTVIVVDDGVATGATMRSALESARMAGARRVVAAVPVASQEGLDSLRQSADVCISLLVPPGFGAVGAFYDDFDQTTDEEVMGLMRESGRGAEGA